MANQSFNHSWFGNRVRWDPEARQLGPPSLCLADTTTSTEVSLQLQLWLTGFLISVGLASGVRVGTQKLGSLGLPFSVPSLEPSLAGLEEEEEELATLELVVASSATLLMLGAME